MEQYDTVWVAYCKGINTAQQSAGAVRRGEAGKRAGGRRVGGRVNVHVRDTTDRVCTPPPRAQKRDVRLENVTDSKDG